MIPASKKIDIFGELQCDMDPNEVGLFREDNDLAMFIYHKSDLNAAIFYITKSFEKPLGPGAIKYIFVQEAAEEGFISCLENKIRPYSKFVLGENLVSLQKETIDILDKMPVEDVFVHHVCTPILVYNVTAERLVANKQLPLTTIFTFRTTKEAIALSKKVQFQTATIWCMNHEIAYEIVRDLQIPCFQINCCNVSRDPVKGAMKSETSFATIIDKLHYEQLVSTDFRKLVIFPVGTTFAN